MQNKIFLVDKFSMNMFTEPNLLFVRNRLTEDQFYHLISTRNVYSCIAAEDIANRLGVAYNPDIVKARIGDIILLAQMNRGVMEYYCIQVCPNTHPFMQGTEVEELI